MRLLNLPLVVAASLWIATFAHSTHAKPLDAAHVTADATWVVHVDFDALQEMSMIQTLREKYPEATKRVREWLQRRYGIDPGEDLHGLTMFSNTYEEHTGSAILVADFDMPKVQSNLQKIAVGEPEVWQGQAFYTIELEKGKKYDWPIDRAISRERAEHPTAYQVTIALIDGKQAVYASSLERAKTAVELLKGEGKSYEGRESDLLAEVPPGAVAYGAAIHLENIKRHEGVFPVLQQHERAVWSAGEHDGHTFKHLTLVAKSAETAEQMKSMLDGLVAFSQVWAADAKSLQRMTQHVETAQKGNAVEARWEIPNDVLLAAMGDLMQRVSRWRSASR